MPLPAIIQTSDTFNTWLSATNNLISHVANTAVFLQGQATASPAAVTGNTALSGTFFLSSLNVNTNITIGGTATANIAAPITLSGATTISGAVSITNTLTQSGPVNISGTVAVNAASVTFSGTGILVSNVAVTIANTLAVLRATTLQNTVTVNGAVTMANTSDHIGAAMFANTITVAGAATFSNAANVATTLNVGGQVTFANTLNVAGLLTATSDAALQGNVFIGSNSIATSGYLTVRQTSTFQNTTSFNGLSTFNAGVSIPAGSLTVNSVFVVNSTGFVTSGQWRGTSIPTTHTAAKVVTVNGQAADGSGNVSLSASAVTGAVDTTTVQTITGRKTVQSGAGLVAQTTTGLGALEINSVNDLHAAMIAFHRPGQYAVYFGLDTDNVLKVGGWSAGAVSYTLLHSGNFTNYAPNKTNGVGATGTWPISITGSAASATTATSATSATSASVAATQSTSSNDTSIATTAFVRNLLNAGGSWTHSISGSAGSVAATSGVPAGTFASGTYTFPGQISIPAGLPGAPSLKITNGSGTNAGIYASSDAIEFGARYDVVNGQSIVRAYHGESKVDFIVGGRIPFFVDDSAVSVGGASYTGTSLSVWGSSTLRGHVYPGANGTYDLGDNGGSFLEQWRYIYLVNPPVVSSDIRYKTVVASSIPNPLTLLERVNPFLYFRTEDVDRKVVPGFAAQQIRSEIDDVLGTKIVLGHEDSLGVSGEHMIPVLWAIVQSLWSEVKTLKGETYIPSPIATSLAALSSAPPTHLYRQDVVVASTDSVDVVPPVKKTNRRKSPK